MKNLTFLANKSLNWANEALLWLGYIGISGVVLITFVDVTGRYLFNKPLVGSFELVELIMGIAVGSAIFYATIKRGHVAIDLIIIRFSRNTQLVLQRIFSFLGFVTWAVISYRTFLYILEEKLTATTDVLSVIMAPFLLILVLGLFLSCVVWLIQAFQPELPEESVNLDDRSQ